VQDVARAFNEMGERLDASQRSQRDFVANVSHDLKTPLTSIQGYAQAILDGASDAPDAAQVIYDEAGRMHRMVLDLLDLARMDAGTLGFEWAPVDLGGLLRGVVQKHTLQVQRGLVELRLDMPGENGDEPLVLVGDADRLAQVFANLVDNAVKFTPAHGQVQIAARLVEGWAEVAIADNGPGIPAGELERIFERFYQVDKARPGGERRGVGLGLAIAREIVEAHGGTIQASNRSAVESGCIFTVRLPLSHPPDRPLAQRQPSDAKRSD
jgi:signal transduction histidine kinase